MKDYQLDKYNIQFIGLEVDYLARQKMEVYAQLAVNIAEGKVEHTTTNQLWIDWKKENKLNEVQSFLLFKTVFLSRILFGCLAWHNDNYIGPPTAA